MLLIYVSGFQDADIDEPSHAKDPLKRHQNNLKHRLHDDLIIRNPA